MTVLSDTTPLGLEAGPTQRLAEHAAAIRYEDLPVEVREVAHHCILDWLGVTLAGAREPLSDILFSQLGDHSDGAATLIGRRGARQTILNAALINGAASHALDFDDTHAVMSGHPSVPVIPAALAVAEREHASGKRFLAAVVAGIELECRLGALVNPPHYLAGFHATGTLGTFGAAAAAAHLLRLESEAWLHALGLAGTQAAGLKSAFGSMAKPLHAGKAAQDGLLAALLASGGYTGHRAILESRQGFIATHGLSRNGGERIETAADRFLICDTLFKYHAACYLTHSAIDAVRMIRSQNALEAAEVASIRVRVPPSSLDVCNIGEPRTGLEGKFSLRATSAMALVGVDTSDLASYSDELMHSPSFVAARDRVTIEAVDGVSAMATPVTITTRSGETFEATVDAGQPERDLERQRQRLSEKFSALATPVIGRDSAAQLHRIVDQLDTLSDVSVLAEAAG